MMGMAFIMYLFTDISKVTRVSYNQTRGILSLKGERNNPYLPPPARAQEEIPAAPPPPGYSCSMLELKIPFGTMIFQVDSCSVFPRQAIEE